MLNCSNVKKIHQSQRGLKRVETNIESCMLHYQNAVKYIPFNVNHSSRIIFLTTNHNHFHCRECRPLCLFVVRGACPQPQPQFTPRSQYYAAKTIWFWEQIVKLGIKLLKIDTTEQLGDIFTKGLVKTSFEYLGKKLMGWQIFSSTCSRGSVE